MNFVQRSHQLFYLAVAAAIIASAVVIATAHLPEKKLQTSNASSEQNTEMSSPDDSQMNMDSGY